MSHARIHPLFTAAALALWMSCHAAARQGRPIFIDPVSGSDQADGLTAQTPWKSAERLKKSPLVPGDHVRFKAGTTHRGTVSVSGAGDGEAPVLIGRYGEGAAPVIDGGGASAALVVTNLDYLILSDLEITNRADTVSPRNGVEIRANDGTTAREIVLRRLHVHHVSGHDDRNGGCGILAGAGRSADGRASRYDGLRIEDCLLHDLPFNGMLVSGWETRGRNARGDLEDPSTRVVIRGNLLHDIAGDAICIITTRGAIIEHNEVYRSSLGQTRGNPEAASAAIWPHTSDSTVMRYNRVEGLRGKKDGQAFDVDYDCRDTLIEHNFTRDNGTGFLLVCAGMENGRDLGTRRVRVRNNLCVDECAEAPGALITLVSRVSDIVFENNAFIFSKPGARRLLYAGNWLGPDWPDDINFRGNLLITAGTLFNEAKSATAIRFSGNLWSGAFQFDPSDTKAVHAGSDLLTAISESFSSTIRNDRRVRQIGFKNFDPSKAGLAHDSPWRHNASSVRTLGVIHPEAQPAPDTP